MCAYICVYVGHCVRWHVCVVGECVEVGNKLRCYSQGILFTSFKTGMLIGLEFNNYGEYLVRED